MMKSKAVVIDNNGSGNERCYAGVVLPNDVAVDTSRALTSGS